MLGLPDDASDDDIRKQYRKLAVLIHPDKVQYCHSLLQALVVQSAIQVLNILNGVSDRSLNNQSQVFKVEIFENRGSSFENRAS